MEQKKSLIIAAFSDMPDIRPLDVEGHSETREQRSGGSFLEYGFSAHAELYDPATGAFTPSSDMTVFGLLNNGQSKTRHQRHSPSSAFRDRFPVKSVITET